MMIRSKDKFWFLVVNSFLAVSVGAFLKVATKNPYANYVILASLIMFLLAVVFLIKNTGKRKGN
jgi:hypothetical protein